MLGLNAGDIALGNHGNARSRGSEECTTAMPRSPGYHPGGGLEVHTGGGTRGGGGHCGHHMKILLPQNYRHVCIQSNKINQTLKTITMNNEEEKGSLHGKLQSTGLGPGERRRHPGTLEDRLLAVITESVKADSHMVITSLLSSSTPQQQHTILQEAISLSLHLRKLDFLHCLIDLSGLPEPEPFNKVPFRDVFRLCHEWCEVRTLIHFGLRHKGALLRQWDPCGRTVIQLALVHGDKQLCHDIMAAEPEILSVRNSCGQTTLQVAVACDGSAECIRGLLASGADPTEQSANGHTPLTEAALCGNVVALCEMVQRPGTDVNLPDRAGFTALHQAVSGGHVDCVRTLLDAGASVQDSICNNHEDITNDGISLERTPPLILAVQGGNVEIVRLLVETGCHPSRRDQTSGWTALHYAVAEYPEPSCLDVLLGSSLVDVNVVTGDGRTALMLAVSFGQCDLVGRLLKHPQCKVNVTDASSSMTALHRASDAGCHLCTATLLAAGALPDVPDQDGATPLLLAVNSRHTHLMAELLLWGPGWWPWQPLSAHELTVMDIVLKRGYWDIGKFLLTSGWCMQDFNKWFRSKSTTGALERSIPKSLNRMLSSPPPLKHVCRLRFKANLGLIAPPEINCLPFPSAIKSYLLFEDLSNAILHPAEQ